MNTRKRLDSESDWEIHNPFKGFQFLRYMSDELTQSVRKERLRESDVRDDPENRPYRNRVYTFIAIPRYLESFMLYGWLQCFDHMLLLYTFMPLRCLLAVCAFVVQTLLAAGVKGLDVCRVPRCMRFLSMSLVKRWSSLFWQAQEMKDLIKFTIIILCSVILGYFDWSIVYHEIRTQSIMKLYIFFNMLELTDRLLSSVCQDAMDDLLLTVTLLAGRKMPTSPSTTPRNLSPTRLADDLPSFTIEDSMVVEGNRHTESRHHTTCHSRDKLFFDLFIQYIFAFICIFAHCFLLFCQVTTLNVAFNTRQNSLLTVMFSNNFVELKGSVFKKMGKTNLFQITCADVRERFHYSLWVIIVMVRNITASGYNNEYLREMMFTGVCLILSEFIVDWIKHAFITKFNVIPADVYKEYKVSIAYDLLLCRQGKHNGDYSEVLSRRMGLTPIPLSCLVNVMLLRNISFSWYMIITVPLVIFILFVVKFAANLLLLSAAFKVVKTYISTKQAELNPEKTSTPLLRKRAMAGDTGLKPKIYTGYDQPTADEGQFHRNMPRRTFSGSCPPTPPARRTHSDSFCAISQAEIENLRTGHIANFGNGFTPDTTPPGAFEGKLRC
ncbi:Transmembrane anterior posterior transformation protein 1 [Cichlidogyrus casuarinus]|uniref:Transmembrane anterior posterior transformation protein 1 n=1 Tax=Cichlidogyrus casuarinus TaxID=1844966 RepID=A0ABD2QBP7_9PLAT